MSAQEPASGSATPGRIPIPTSRLLALAALGLIPTLLAAAFPGASRGALAYDGLLLLLALADWLLAPSPSRLRLERRVPSVLSAGVRQLVELHLTFPGRIAVRGEMRDVAPVGIWVDQPRQPFTLSRDASECVLRYHLESPRRGDFQFGDAHIRLFGPLGLCARQGVVPLARTVKVFPDLSALARDALALARASEDWAKRPLRRIGEGSEFESLRPWSNGDDLRHIDWKATARCGHPIVRVHQPERNQRVLLLLDCGRHMAGLLHGRRKLDHAVDAALRVARVALDAGDAVGLLAFGSELRAHLAPRRGREHLRAITQALYRIEAQLVESDYGRALDLAFRDRSRRALVVVFSDLLDRETSSALVQRTLALLPRHLPILVSILDEELESTARDAPASVPDAYARHVAASLSEEYRLNASRLQARGARVVRAPASALGAAAVSDYLFVKGRGLL